MKKICILLLFFLFLCGCEQKPASGDNAEQNPAKENNETPVVAENTYDYTLTATDYDCYSGGNYNCNIRVYDDCMIFFNYVDNYSAMIFSKYDFKEGKTYELGRVENPYADSGDIAAYDGKLYYYCTSFVKDEEHPDGIHVNSLYQIDLVNNTMVKLAESYTEQTLVYIDVVDGKVISWKGTYISDIGVTYLDVYELSGQEGTDFEMLVQKEWDNKTQQGEAIYQYSIDNEMIYVLVQQEEQNEILWKIEKYDLEGNYLDAIAIENEDVIAFLGTNHFTDFEVMGDYIIYRNFGGGGLLVNMSSGEEVIELQEEMDFDVAVSVDAKQRSYAVFFKRETGKAWELNVETHTLTEIDFPFETLGCIWVNNEGEVVVADQNVYYKNY